MATCKDCGIRILVCLFGKERVALDPGPRTFAPITDGHERAQDSDRCFASTAFVEHSTTCAKRPTLTAGDPELVREAELFDAEPPVRRKVRT